MEIHVISNGRQSLDRFASIASSVSSEVSYIHLREKSRTAREILQGIQLLLERGIPLSKIVINDRVDAAYVSGACGVHLAYHSLPVRKVKAAFPQLRVGCSIHSEEEALFAWDHGADYVLFGHIYATNSKPDLQPRGIEKLARIVRAVPIPVIAIGGIKPEHVAEIKATGASGFAVMSSIVETEYPEFMIKAYSKGVHDV